MSEDRTQEPSKRRILEARERGQVARSPELTGAVGLLTASALLGIWGDDLVLGLLQVVREGWSGDLGVGADLNQVVDRFRHAAWSVVGPLVGIVGGPAVAAILAHQAQVGGLFAPNLLVPDPTRLWNVSLGEDDSGGSKIVERAGRGVWSVIKAGVVVAVSAWLIRSDLNALYGLGRLGPPGLARASGAMLRSTAFTLAAATLILGLIDYVLQRRRFDAMMRLTSDEHREELRSADGDPSLRARRRKQAQALRGDAPELMAGASLAVVGTSGLVVILAGGPPPRRVLVRASANGATGRRMIRSADAAKLGRLESPKIALSLARLQSPLVPPELLAELAAAWPTETGNDVRFSEPPAPK